MQSRLNYSGRHFAREAMPAWLQAAKDGFGDFMIRLLHKAVMSPQFVVAAVIDNLTLSSRLIRS